MKEPRTNTRIGREYSSSDSFDDGDKKNDYGDGRSDYGDAKTQIVTNKTMSD